MSAYTLDVFAVAKAIKEKSTLDFSDTIRDGISVDLNCVAIDGKFKLSEDWSDDINNKIEIVFENNQQKQTFLGKVNSEIEAAVIILDYAWGEYTNHY